MATPKLDFTTKELQKMDRQELITLFMEQQSFAISTLKEFAEVNRKLADMATEIATIKESKTVVPASNISEERFSRMEREHFQMQQYSRRLH